MFDFFTLWFVTCQILVRQSVSGLVPLYIAEHHNMIIRNMLYMLYLPSILSVFLG